MGVAVLAVACLMLRSNPYKAPAQRRPEEIKLWSVPHEDSIDAKPKAGDLSRFQFAESHVQPGGAPHDGDHAGEHGEDDDSHKMTGHSHGHSHGYLSLFFLLGGLSMGCILQVIQERWLRQVPYTCLLFILGFVLACIHELRPEGHWSKWPAWYISVGMWEDVNPHLIFYIFLPALVFAEAMRLNVKLAITLLPQVVLLACPGVLMGTGLTAAFSKYVLPYGWSWATSLVFGSILAATDPVAVVSLFNTLGVSPRLTMLISGESLLNDGTAIVCFSLMLKLVLGTPITVSDTLSFAAWMVVVAAALGVALAFCALTIIEWCAETKYHTDAMIQVIVTMCLGFLCFFLAEAEVHTSGVLTVVSAGSIFSYIAWPRFASRETMHIVWEAIEFIGNTVIFILAGLLFGHRCLTRTSHLEWSDIGWLFVLYLGLTLIRGVMVLCLWPFLNWCGEPITWQEALVMVWSGLRGAVGLVLAIIVDLEPAVEPVIGSHVMFHVGGIAMLTILVNATLCGPLLQALGLTQTPEVEESTVEHFQKMTNEYARGALAQIAGKSEDVRFRNANQEAVKRLVPSLAHGYEHGDGADDHDFDLKLQTYREIFMRAIEAQYWDDIEGGLIPRTSRIARILLFSASSALLNSGEPLNDWEHIAQKVEERQWCSAMSSLCEQWPLSSLEWLQQIFPSTWTVDMWKAYTSLAFIDAHRSAQVELPRFFFQDSVLGKEVQEQVAAESSELIEQATAQLEVLPAEAIEHCKSRMLAGKLLHLQIEKVASLKKQGLLDEKGSTHIVHHLQEEYRGVVGRSMSRIDSRDRKG